MPEINDKLKEELKKLALKKLNKFSPDMDALSQERAELLDAYNRQLYGNEVNGRSKFVSADVYETVENAKPALLRMFLGGPDIVSVKPRKYQGPQSTESAKLLEEKDNFDFLRLDSGFMTTSDFITDGLLGKFGAVKTTWHTEEKEIYKKYSDLNELEAHAILNSDFEVEEVKETSVMSKVPNPDMPDQVLEIPVKTFDIEGREVHKLSYAHSECVPPEDVIFDPYDPNPRTMFMAHRRLMYKSEIIDEYGIDEQEINQTVNRWQSDLELQARYKDLKYLSFISPTADDDRAYIHECYLWKKKEGKTDYYIVTLLGDEVLRVELNKYGRQPFSLNSPKRVSHRAIGKSLAELATDYQKVNTALIRNILDGLYFQINKRALVDPLSIDIDMLLNDNVPSGVVFTLNGRSPEQGYRDITPTPISADLYRMIDILNGMRENTTGMMSNNPSPVPQQALYTSTGTSAVMGKMNEPLELVARYIAEGLKDMFQFRIELNTQFFSGKSYVEVNAEWKEIDANKISGLFDVVIDIGGTGTKEMVVQQMNQILNTFGMILKILGHVPPEVAFKVLPFTPEDVFNVVKEMLVMMGYKDAERFCTMPMVKNWLELMGGVNGGQQIPGAGPAGPGGAGIPAIPGLQELAGAVGGGGVPGMV